jgi:hypothetical protein
MIYLEDIFIQYGIAIIKEDGSQRPFVDILEDMTIALDPEKLLELFMTITSNDGMDNNLFQTFRDTY